MEIRIDPANEPRRVLLAMAAMLTTLAGGADAIAPADRPDVGADLKATETRAMPETAGQVIGFKRFVAEGTPNPTIIDPAQAFGAGNVGAASGSVSSPTPVPTGAASSATIPPIPGVPPVPTGADSQIDPAAAFGGGAGVPNGALSAGVPPAVPAPPAIVPPPGMPAVPNNGAATAGASTVELDADGLPWDSRIHSSAKNKNAGDKKWKAKRGVMPQLVASVTAELRAALSAGGNVQAPAGAPPVPPATIPPATLTPPPPGLTTTGSGASASAPTFQMLLPRVTSAMAAGTLTQETAGQLCAYISEGKVSSVAMLAVAPQLVPAMWAQLDAMGVA